MIKNTGDQAAVKVRVEAGEGPPHHPVIRVEEEAPVTKEKDTVLITQGPFMTAAGLVTATNLNLG